MEKLQIATTPGSSGPMVTMATYQILLKNTGLL